MPKLPPNLAMLQGRGEECGPFSQFDAAPSVFFFETDEDMKECFVKHIDVVAKLCRVTTVLKDELNGSLPQEIFWSHKFHLDPLW